MNEAEILQILKNNDAPATLENINRVMQQSGRGTELLGRSLGLQGGTGEEGPGMDLMLDKIIKNTSTPAQMPVSPGGENINPAQSSAAVSDAPSRSPVVAAPSSAPRRAGGMSVNTEPPSGSLGMDINNLIATPAVTAPPERGTSSTAVDNSMVDLPNVPMSMKDYAFAAGIPLGSAAVGYALYQKMAGLDGATKMQPSDLGVIDKIANGPRAMEMGDLFAKGQDPASIRKMMDEVAAENAALKLGPEPAVSPGTAAIDKVAADTASRNPKNNPKRPKAPPRTAVQGVTAGPTEEVVGPNRDATVVNDGKAKAEKAKSDAALKAAEKPQAVPPAKATGSVSSIKDPPFSPPVDPNTIPFKGPIEAMPNRSSNAFIDLLNAVKKLHK
jgi:hypothetical protein